MTLAPGTKLGPYEILAPIGAGGMGEVWRARHAKLQREVAIKVLPPSLAEDPVALARFEREARAVAALSHPGILAIHDFGSENGTAYAVMELLEGETLRQRLAGGTIPQRKAVEYAREIALALAAAHEKGIVHRDLKPENVFLTREGRVKLLDFGLAKESVARQASDTASPTIPRETDPGTVLGTAGYMSPEQVRGRAVDHRSDIFSFGAVLYEMLSGKRAFAGDTAADTMSAILTQDPSELAAPGRNVPPALDRIVRHCLEKNPAERFQSARDIVFDLDALSTPSAPARAVTRRSWAPWLRGAGFVLLGAAIASALLLHRSAPMASFRLLTFKRGTIRVARFAPDGQSAVYGAAWDGRPKELFTVPFDSPISRALGVTDTDLLDASRTGDLAVLLSPKDRPGFVVDGTLARLPLAGGAPRPLRPGVHDAALSPDGRSLAVVAEAGGLFTLEYPAGHVIYSTSGWISHVHVSPDGKLVAFCDHEQVYDDGGRVAVVEPGRPARRLTPRYATLQGLAFAPDGKEIWYTGVESGAGRRLWAVSLGGRVRPLAEAPGTLTLQDVDRSGRALVSRDVQRLAVFGLAPGADRERDLSELDFTRVMGLSADGRTVLVDETGEGGGPGYSVFVKRMDDSPAIRISQGNAMDLSPDGAWAIVGDLGHPAQVIAVPTGPGEPRALTHDAINHEDAKWLGGTDRIVFFGAEPGHARRLWTQAVGKAPRPVTPEGTRGLLHSASPDAKAVAWTVSSVGVFISPLDGGSPRPIPGTGPEDRFAGWGADGTSVFIVGPGLPAPLSRVDLATGRRVAIAELGRTDPVGMTGLGRVFVVADGRAYAYFSARILSELYLLEGLK